SKVDVAIDLGNPLLNRTVDGFLKIGARSAPAGWPPRTPSTASKVVTTQPILNCPESCHYLEHTGAVAGVYVGMEYGVERVRGEYDWKNALIGGIASGALISAASNNKGNKIAKDAITGGAIATAIEFINYLT
uniref:Uncharacterized protein n=1 Tax=Aegilops tauschii subsp. strangulata TaxID=200361 RepID=A0A452XN18_AEGTS